MTEKHKQGSVEIRQRCVQSIGSKCSGKGRCQSNPEQARFSFISTDMAVSSFLVAIENSFLVSHGIINVGLDG